MENDGIGWEEEAVHHFGELLEVDRVCIKQLLMCEQWELVVMGIHHSLDVGGRQPEQSDGPSCLAGSRCSCS